MHYSDLLGHPLRKLKKTDKWRYPAPNYETNSVCNSIWLKIDFAMLRLRRQYIIKLLLLVLVLSIDFCNTSIHFFCNLPLLLTHSNIYQAIFLSLEPLWISQLLESTYFHYLYYLHIFIFPIVPHLIYFLSFPNFSLSQ